MKKIHSDDKFICSKNCKGLDEYGMQNCEDVVRNWQPLPISKTFENYKE